ncbi:hypothetical protein PsorP6_008275 [Peronosclerospora sorghi]|uniref:Uncharacterized protein n=1 Tax=Peronosclerospora sorghi TaxID=230839 RepID=A0ACC0W767_9STRA|nr:hypothetical protein PsorP6_008275 [Peronosclerospora sorghi]
MALTKYVTFQCMVASSVNAAYRLSPVANHPSLSRFSSKSLVFGAIQLQDGGTFQQLKKIGANFVSNNARDILNARVLELLEVMMDIAAIRQINWDVHLRDMVTVRGVLQRKHSEAGYSNGWLVDLVSIRVDESWCLHHTGTVFNYTVSDVAPPTTLLCNPEMVTLRGVLQRKHSEAGYSNGWLVDLVSIRVDEPCTTHDAAVVKGSWLLPPCSKVATNTIFHRNVCEESNATFGMDSQRILKRINAAGSKNASKNAQMLHILPTQRSRIFCDWLVESLGEEFLASGTGVVDVAGGKGDIPVLLWIKRGIQTTLIDPRPMKLGKYNRKLVAKASAAKGRTMNPQLLDSLDDDTLKLYKDLFTNCSVLVRMHPDEATEAIVDASLTLRKPFSIVPCFVMSRFFPDRLWWDGTPVVTYETFIKYLREKHPSYFMFSTTSMTRVVISLKQPATIRQKLERYTFLLQL